MGPKQPQTPTTTIDGIFLKLVTIGALGVAGVGGVIPAGDNGVAEAVKGISRTMERRESRAAAELKELRDEMRAEIKDLERRMSSLERDRPLRNRAGP